MSGSAQVFFTEIKNGTIPAVTNNALIFAIRTDAAHATAGLKDHLVAYLRQQSPSTSFRYSAQEIVHDRVETRIRQVLHSAYQKWGHTVLQVTADCLDYRQYGLSARHNQLHVHFHDAHDLAEGTIGKAHKLGRQTGGRNIPPFFVSLDEMLERNEGHFGAVGFSRLFSINGCEEYDYVGRPGRQSLDEQFHHLRTRLQRLESEHTAKIPIVLLEDNVRRAKMLNWFFAQMDRHGIFQHAQLAGISTSFCVATQQEREAIRHESKKVPLAAVVDYKNANVDVVTPRDFLFDGFVVDVDGNKGRLPGLFMDVAGRFKVRPDRTGEFKERIAAANEAFCSYVQDKLEVTIPLAWFAAASPIAHVTGHSVDAPMARVMRELCRCSDNMPPSEAATSPLEAHKPSNPHQTPQTKQACAFA